MNTNGIGKNISELRKAKGLTQDALASAIGVTPQAVSKWETGGAPDVELLPLIADYFGVSIDKLFGRSFIDYNDLQSEIAKNLIDTPSDKRFNKAFEFCWEIEKSLFGHRRPDDVNMSVEYVQNRETGDVHSQMLTNDGLTLVSLGKKMQYFFLIPQPQDDWADNLPNTEQYTDLFKVLSQPDIFNTVYLLYSRENKPFTPKLLEKELGIEHDRSVEILGLLKQYSLIGISDIELDDEVQGIYNFTANPAFIPLLISGKEILKRPNLFYCYSNGRNRPYFKKKHKP